MATFVLIPGAASGPWYWHLLQQALAVRGHGSVAVDLPSEDDSAGLDAYASTAVRGVAEAGMDPQAGVAVVAHSFGGFTGPIVADRLAADLLVLVTAMVPKPGEAPGDWWAATGQGEAQRARAELDGIGADEELTDAYTYYLDVPDALTAQLEAEGRGQSGTPMGEPWPLDAWPDVPTRFILCTEDRLLPPDLMRAVVADRLGVVPDELEAGHLPMLSRPDDLADLLVAAWAELGHPR